MGFHHRVARRVQQYRYIIRSQSTKQTQKRYEIEKQQQQNPDPEQPQANPKTVSSVPKEMSQQSVPVDPVPGGKSNPSSGGPDSEIESDPDSSVKTRFYHRFGFNTFQWIFYSSILFLPALWALGESIWLSVIGFQTFNIIWPSWGPPFWFRYILVFMELVLFLMIGSAICLVVHATYAKKRRLLLVALLAHFSHVFCTCLWPILMFASGAGCAALMFSSVATALSAVTMFVFGTVKLLAGLLLLPYTIWNVYMTAVTYGILSHTMTGTNSTFEYCQFDWN